MSKALTIMSFIIFEILDMGPTYVLKKKDTPNRLNGLDQ